MIIERVPCGVYAANCYIVGDETTKEGIIVDPAGEKDKILNFIQKLGLNINYIVLTHGHGDHIGALKKLKEELDVPVYIHEEDERMIIDKDINLSSQMTMEEVELTPDKLLKDGDEINFGNITAHIIHTPGHTPGSIVIKINNKLITGDTLFKGSIGRTDLPGGSYDKILESIKNKLLNFDDETSVLPGHGPSSTIGIEKMSNPFIRNL